MADFNIPKELRYTRDHEWVRLEGDVVRVGITDYAQDALTDVVYVELPAAGDAFAEGDSLGVVESVKSVSDIYSPVAGTVIEANQLLEDHPELMNEQPYQEGWYALIEPDDASAVDDLLTAAEYADLVGGR